MNGKWETGAKLIFSCRDHQIFLTIVAPCLGQFWLPEDFRPSWRKVGCVYITLDHLSIAVSDWPTTWIRTYIRPWGQPLSDVNVLSNAPFPVLALKLPLLSGAVGFSTLLLPVRSLWLSMSFVFLFQLDWKKRCLEFTFFFHQVVARNQIIWIQIHFKVDDRST